MQKDKYFKHDASASSNRKLTELIVHEGMKAYGIYWIIIEEMRKQSDFGLPMTSLDFIRRRWKMRRDVFNHVLFNYGLFTEKDGLFYSAGLCKRMEADYLKKRTAATEEVREPDIKVPEAVTKVPEPGNTTTETVPEKCGKVAANVSKSCSKRVANVLQMKRNSLKTKQGCSLKKEKKKERNKKKATSVAKERPLAADAGFSSKGNKKPPVTDCFALVDSLKERPGWMDLAQKRSGLGERFHTYHTQLLELFKEHITLYGKQEVLRNLTDVQRYFVNFVSPASKTTYERVKQLVERLEAQNPYRFETLIDGQRTYMGGQPIPADAPPRPCVAAQWYMNTWRW